MTTSIGQSKISSSSGLFFGAKKKNMNARPSFRRDFRRRFFLRNHEFAYEKTSARFWSEREPSSSSSLFGTRGRSFTWNIGRWELGSKYRELEDEGNLPLKDFCSFSRSFEDWFENKFPLKTEIEIINQPGNEIQPPLKRMAGSPKIDHFVWMFFLFQVVRFGFHKVCHWQVQVHSGGRDSNCGNVLMDTLGLCRYLGQTWLFFTKTPIQIYFRFYLDWLLRGGFTLYGIHHILAWNPKQPVLHGCFNWMIPNLYIGNGCFTKHLFINGCLGFQERDEYGSKIRIPLLGFAQFGDPYGGLFGSAKQGGGVSKNGPNLPWPKGRFGCFQKYGKTPKSAILIGFSIINHPFWGTPIFGNTHLFHQEKSSFLSKLFKRKFLYGRKPMSQKTNRLKTLRDSMCKNFPKHRHG